MHVLLLVPVKECLDSAFGLIEFTVIEMNAATGIVPYKDSTYCILRMAVKNDERVRTH